MGTRRFHRLQQPRARHSETEALDEAKGMIDGGGMDPEKKTRPARSAQDVRLGECISPRWRVGRRNVMRGRQGPRQRFNSSSEFGLGGLRGQKRQKIALSAFCDAAIVGPTIRCAGNRWRKGTMHRYIRKFS